MSDGRINFKFTADNSDVVSKADQTDRALTGMADDAEKAGARVGSAFRATQEAARTASQEWTGAASDIKDSVNTQKAVIADLEKQYKATQKAVEAMSPGASQQAAAREMQNIRKEIEAEKTALKMLTDEQEKAKNSSVSMRTQMRNLREELSKLPEGTAEYAKKVRELGEIQDRYGDVNKQGQIFADDNKYLRASTEAMQGFSGAMQIGAGAMAVLGVNSENAQKITAKLMAVMTIANGVTQVANVLNKDSYVSHLLVAGAKNVVTAATTRLSVALGISTVAAKILMATLTLGLSVAITAVILALDRMGTASAAAAESQKELNERNKQFAESTAATAAKQLLAYEGLRKAYTALGDDLKAKEKFVKDNEKAFQDLGVSITSAASADKVFISGTGDFKDSIMERAKSIASMELAAEAYKKYLEKMTEAEQRRTVTQKDREEATKGMTGPARAQLIRTQPEVVEARAGEVAGKAAEKFEKEAEVQLSLFESYADKSSRLSEAAKKKLESSGGTVYDSAAEKARLQAEQDVKTREEKARSTRLEREKEYYKEELNQWTQAKREELVAYRATLSDKEELRKFDLEQTLADIDAQEEAYKRLAELAGAKTPDTKVFEERRTTAKQASEQVRKQTEEDEAKRKQEENTKILKQYQTFTEEYLAKTKEFEEKRAAILAAGGTEDNVAVLKKNTEEQQKQLDEQYYKNTEGFKAFAEETVGLTLLELEKLLAGVEADLAASTESIESEGQAALRAQIEILKDQLKAKQAKDPSGKEKELKQWQSTQKVLSGIVQTANQVIDSFDGISDSTKKVLKTVINVSSSALSMIDSIKMFGIGSAKAVEGTAVATAESIKTVEKGSVILAVIAAALQIATAIVDLFVGSAKKRREEMAKIEKETYEQERAYNELLRERALMYGKGVTIFGVDEYGKAINAAKEGLKELDNLQRQLGTKQTRTGFGGWLDQVKEKIRPIKGEFAALDSIMIKTGTRSSGFLGLGKTDTYESLLSLYPKVINEQGRFDAKVAQGIIDTREMSEESKRALEGMIDTANQVEAAFQQVQDFLSNIFGELGNNMTAGIVESFKAGKSAATTFVDDIGSLLEQLANQMLYSIMLQPLFEAASKQMSDITTDITLSPEEQFKRMSKVLGQLSKDATGKQAEMSALLEQFKKDAAEQGLDIYKKESEKQAQAKGREAMSLTEETGSALEGKLTAVQLTSAQTADNTKLAADSLIRIEPLILDVRDTIDILTLNSRKTYDEVVLIRGFAASLPEIDKKMSQIVTNTAGLV